MELGLFASINYIGFLFYSFSGFKVSLHFKTFFLQKWPFEEQCFLHFTFYISDVSICGGRVLINSGAVFIYDGAFSICGSAKKRKSGASAGAKADSCPGPQTMVSVIGRPFLRKVLKWIDTLRERPPTVKQTNLSPYKSSYLNIQFYTKKTFK